MTADQNFDYMTRKHTNEDTELVESFEYNAVPVEHDGQYYHFELSGKKHVTATLGMCRFMIDNEELYV